MSTVSDLIFKGGEHYLSSPFGKRKVLSTSAGKTSSFHSGADYATHGVKLPQYSITDGTILSCGTDYANANALFVWVAYPSLGVKMLHYHLDSISVKKGQTVKKGTQLGKTGKTGRSTGIHLHLGIKSISGGDWIDPEAWSKNEYPKLIKKNAEEKKAKYTTGNYKVTVAVLHVRSGAGIKHKNKLFNQLTKNAQQQILKLNGNKKADGYVKGMTFTASKIKEADGYTWGKTPSGWVALDYCKKV